MTRREIIRQLEEEYAERRRRHEAELAAREEAAFAADPEILRLRADNAALTVDSLKRIIEDKSCAAEVSRQMKARGLENNRRIRERLVAAGLGEAYLDMEYTCPICRDTGYIGDAQPRMCECFEKQLLARMFTDAGISRSDERFETFDERFVPDELIEGHKYTQRRLAVAVKQRVEAYANAYPNPPKPNMVLFGKSGLGKTFLLNALAARLMERGFPVLKATAYQLFDAMRKQHFHSAEGDESLRPFLEAPILLIDDLGSEPLMKNVTVEYLYVLLNERCSARRPTVICTNLTQEQIKERYFERIFSRMFDQRICDAYELEGRDLRTQ